uniref:ABC transmembrane type-1 domain-containing protein n=1 Tax=Caenorhabditis japonica TaxID=281687 RepID=A0A8R1ER37_CAEJA
MGRWLNTCLYLYMILDVAVTNVAFGYFARGWTFDEDKFLSTISFSAPYYFTSSPYEFQILSFIRQAFCAIAVILIVLDKTDKVKALFNPITFNAVFTYSFSLTKFLAFSEIEEQLKYPGVWISVAWAILSGSIQVIVWYFVFQTDHFDYHQLINIAGNAEESSEQESPSESQNVESGTSARAPAREPLHKFLFRLLSYCGHQWPWFAAGFTFLNIYALARVFIPKYTAQVIADIVNGGGFHALVHSILVLCALTATSSFFGGLRGGCFDYATALVTLRIRLDLFTSLINQDISFFDTTKTGETMSRLTSDCQTISSTVSTNVNVFMRNGVMLVGALAFMFAMSWRLAMVTFIAVPFVAFITKVYSKFYDVSIYLNY